MENTVQITSASARLRNKIFDLEDQRTSEVVTTSELGLTLTGRWRDLSRSSEWPACSRPWRRGGSRTGWRSSAYCPPEGPSLCRYWGSFAAWGWSSHSSSIFSLYLQSFLSVHQYKLQSIQIRYNLPRDSAYFYCLLWDSLDITDSIRVVSNKCSRGTIDSIVIQSVVTRVIKEVINIDFINLLLIPKFSWFRKLLIWFVAVFFIHYKNLRFERNICVVIWVSSVILISLIQVDCDQKVSVMYKYGGGCPASSTTHCQDIRSSHSLGSSEKAKTIEKTM